MNVRTRFAPSPTGFMHIGSLRTALYCYAMAKKHKGEFILRIEDTDQSRYNAAGEAEIYEMLAAYGVAPDESDQHGGDFGPYTQSKRLEKYHKVAAELVERGGAYYCFLTPEEEAILRADAKSQKRPFRSPHRDLTPDAAQEKLAAGSSYVIRQRIPLGRTLEFTDGVQGLMRFHTDDIDDGVLLKSDGFPTYHLAMLVDDHEMKISHVFRAFEWIPSIPRHVLLYETMGWDIPPLYHLSTILDPAGGKLSKRKGATSAKEFLAQGYLPAAVLNFLMLLGWSSPEERVYGESERELFTLPEFVELFDPKDLNKSNPIFDDQKLLWFNHQYIMQLTNEELMQTVLSWLNTYATDVVAKADMLADSALAAKLGLVKERVHTLSEIPALVQFFYTAPANYDWTIKQLKNVDEVKRTQVLTALCDLHQGFAENSVDWTHADWEQGVRSLADAHQLKHGDVFMLLRVAVVGGPVSPPLFESLQILGRSEVVARLKSAC